MFGNIEHTGGYFFADSHLLLRTYTKDKACYLWSVDPVKKREVLSRQQAAEMLRSKRAAGVRIARTMYNSHYPGLVRESDW
jgi:hypothetical protein